MDENAYINYYRKFWEKQLERCDSFTRFYFGLRLTTISFFLIAMGALLSFAWIYGFRFVKPEELTPSVRFLRWSIVLIATLVSYYTFVLERELRRRQDISWGEARKYEILLEMSESLHTLIYRPSGYRITIRSAFTRIMAVAMFFTGTLTLSEFVINVVFIYRENRYTIENWIYTVLFQLVN